MSAQLALVIFSGLVFLPPRALTDTGGSYVESPLLRGHPRPLRVKIIRPIRLIPRQSRTMRR